MPLLIILCFLLFHAQVHAERYLLGIEAINFYPHYDFSAPHQNGFANEVFALFAEMSGYDLVMVPLPPKRLYHELDRRVDLIYPDHPRWVQYQGTAPARYFSQAVTGNLGTAMIRPEFAMARTEDIRSVAIIRGFTPVAWLSRAKDRIELIEVTDAQSALGLVLRNRVDAADVEYNVANHLLRKMGKAGALVPAMNLPYTLGSYHLSSATHPQVITQFDDFLHKHRQQIEQLKARYQILDRPDHLLRIHAATIKSDP
ncbi:transporter substrate-binding domain-containing protein [Lacimicrobium sp. SS2-24]|uniref:substrate-binding periplasmic protein n=1 Tax=Lacimicrobium sp. SS2-24 TaxID=2005569 RepID=UPI000B4B0118|nr:transporter substrate-binding domain-containing protein [Lacimicrobium sp. SS2-24]